MMRAGHKARDVVDRQIGTGGSRKVDIGIKCTRMNGLHPNHFDHQSFVADEAKLAAVPCLKSRLHRGHITKSYLDTAIGPHIADVHSRFAADVAVDALSAQFYFRFGRQALHNRPKRCLFQRAAKCALAYRPPIRETHAISRQYPCIRMNVDTRHRQRISHAARVLARSASAAFAAEPELAAAIAQRMPGFAIDYAPDFRQAIADSFAHVVAQGREALFDAEHFFDGYKANPAYALSCLRAARDAGARWLVMCDTNGGTLPAEVGRIVGEVIASGLSGDSLGIHCHDDTGNAVANSLAAVEAGCRQIQGTLNGLGERCGNANLVTLIPTLMLKQPFASQLQIGVSEAGLAGLLRLSRSLDDILNRVPLRSAPYVGASAFAHKAGLHASAILKDPTTYEHIDPALVGNERVIPMSNQAGQSNLRARLAAAGVEVAAAATLAATVRRTEVPFPRVERHGVTLEGASGLVRWPDRH